MREIDVGEIIKAVEELCIKANKILPDDLCGCISCAEKSETDELPKKIMGTLLENLDAAKELNLPICQDTGMAVIFCDVGQDVHIVGGDFENAVNEGVSRGYTNGLLRKSIVRDPLDRVNTNDNTPAVIHTRIVPGEKIKLTVAPKGFGSENMSRIYMLKPADGAEGVIRSVVETVKIAGPNPCPPIVLGIGIGGNFETVALAAKKALLKPEGVRHHIPEYAAMETEIINRANELGIGPGGYGGVTTVLDAHIETLPTHIAGMPLAVNICCHALRHSNGTIEGRLCNG